MGYSIKCVDGVQRIFNDDYLTDKFVLRNEEAGHFEIREMSYDDEDNNTPLVFGIPLSYNVDVLLLAYSAYQEGYSKGVNDAY